jgi:hypothetical protein
MTEVKKVFKSTATKTLRSLALISSGSDGAFDVKAEKEKKAYWPDLFDALLKNRKDTHAAAKTAQRMTREAMLKTTHGGI